MASRTIVSVLCEALESGVVFLDGSVDGWLTVPGLFSNSTSLQAASEEFVKGWLRTVDSGTVKIMKAHPPLGLVKGFLKHDLVMIVKLSQKALPEAGPDDGPSINMASSSPQAKAYSVEDIDGLFDHQDILNMVLSGRVRPETRIQVDGELDWKPAKAYAEFQSALQDLVSPAASLATSATSTGKRLAKLPGRRVRYHYYSQKRLPHLTKRQVRYAEDILGIEDDDQLHWMEELVANATPSDTLTFMEIRRRKLTKRRASVEDEDEGEDLSA